jgi:mannose-6-phosphate isomerase-like protein (cupin superfamily)/ribosome-binding protein aMBF1 (putative translation factor)
VSRYTAVHPTTASPEGMTTSRRRPLTATEPRKRTTARKSVPARDDPGEVASIHHALGERLRERRTAADLTLAEVAERSGFGKAYLSRIENGQKVPPIASLARICAVLNVEPAALLAESGSAIDDAPKRAWRGVSVVRHGDRRPTVLGGTAFGYNYLSVGATQGRAMQAFVFSFPDKVDKYVFFEHQGEELLHVLSGTLEWQVGSDKFLVEAGDTVHFDSSIPHRGHSIAGPATALMVMYSPDLKHDELA